MLDRVRSRLHGKLGVPADVPRGGQRSPDVDEAFVVLSLLEEALRDPRELLQLLGVGVGIERQADERGERSGNSLTCRIAFGPRTFGGSLREFNRPPPFTDSVEGPR